MVAIYFQGVWWQELIRTVGQGLPTTRGEHQQPEFCCLLFSVGINVHTSNCSSCANSTQNACNRAAAAKYVCKSDVYAAVP
jgi:hypothetical protein